jgi:PAS domain S-box-containing protein
VTDSVVFIAADGTVVGWNPAAAATFGTRLRENDEPNLAMLFPSEERARAERLLEQCARGDRVRAMLIAARGDGSRLMADVTLAPVEAPAGGSGGFVLVARDVTETMLLHGAAAAVAAGPDPSAALESFFWVLEQVVPLLQLGLSIVEGDRFRRVANGGGAERILRPGETILLERTAIGTAVETRAPVIVGNTRHGRFALDPLLADAGIGSYVILPLFRGRVFAALNVGFAEPEGPTPAVVGLLVRVLSPITPAILNLLTLEEQASAIRELEQLDALKNEFLALITHEIRTPLAVIAGFAEALQQRWNELPDAEKLESIDAIQRSGKNVSRIVDEALQVALIVGGEFTYELRPFDVVEQIEQTIRDLSRRGDRSRLRLIARDRLLLVHADPDRHWQVLTNLISNAIKFSPPDAPIEIEVSREGSNVQVCVRDFGVGIAEADIPKLFRKFSRVGNPEQLRVRGTGLGLFICKALVEAQGGRIWVESKPGEGSEFRYTLRVARQATT